MVNIKTMVATCEHCGSKMTRIDFDNYSCDTCGSDYEFDNFVNEWVFHDVDDIFANSEYSINYAYNNRPAACTGCGSDMYPDCQYSCKLMSDN